MPGTPTVARAPRPPTVTRAPRGPIEREGPDLLKLTVMPGARLIRLKKRKPIQPT